MAKSSDKRKRAKRMFSTQNALPIKDVTKDGIIVTNDDRYIMVMEVISVNFLLKSDPERWSIIDSFKKMLKSGPAKIQLISIAVKQDMSKHLQTLVNDMKKEDSAKCRQLQKEYAQLLKRVGNGSSISRRFFIAFEYEYATGLLRTPTVGEIVGQMNTAASRIISNLEDCGNEVIPADYERTLEILYIMLNRNTCEKVPFDARQKVVKSRYERAGEDLYIPAKDYIAPETLVFGSPTHVVVDGKYYAYAYITSDGYNPWVEGGWMSNFVNAGEGIDVSVHLERIPKEQIMFKLRQSIGSNRASLSGTTDTQSNYEKLVDSVRGGTYIKEGLAAGEDFYYVNTFIVISGDSIDEVNYKFNELKKSCSVMDITIRRVRYECEQAWISSLPICQLDNELNNKSKRNILTKGAASMYPFTSFELCDDDGVYLGTNTLNNSMIMLNIFDSKKYKNANMAIFGTSGAGKTFALLLQAVRMRLKHIPVIIIAPEKEHEFRRVCEAIDGQFIRIGTGSSNTINILDIFKVDESVSMLIDGEDSKINRLTSKIQDLKKFYSILLPDLTYEEKDLLDEAFIKTYKSKGITEDNESLIDENDPARYKEMPILGDLLDVLESMNQDGSTKRLISVTKTFVTGTGKSFNRHTNVNLDNEFVVLGLETLTDDLLPAGMFMAIDYAWSKIKEDRTKRKVLFIDEWWRFAFNPFAAEYSMEIAKTIRAYGGSLIVATQQVSDVFGIENGKYGEAVLNNSKIKILMQMEEADAVKVQEILNLTDDEKSKITHFRKAGEALLIASSNNVTMKFTASKTEFDLITTDRKELERQVREKRKKAERRQMEERMENLPDFTDIPDFPEPEHEDEVIEFVDEEFVLNEEDLVIDFDDDDDVIDFDELEKQYNESDIVDLDAPEGENNI